MAGLRASIRDELERTALSQAKSEYCDQVLERMVAGAEINFSDFMLEQQIDGIDRRSSSATFSSNRLAWTIIFA